MNDQAPEQQHKETRISFGRNWLGNKLVLCVLVGAGTLLCAFLNRCYLSMPWDQWTIFGEPVAYWRKPIAAALLSASFWGVAVSSGALFWWMFSWVTGGHWASGLRRVWENIANAGLGGWIILLPVVGILTTVLFPWADRMRAPGAIASENSWFFQTSFFYWRQGGYLLLMVVLGMVARKCSLAADRMEGEKAFVYQRRMRAFSTLSLPFVVIAMGMMGIDWVCALNDSPVLSMFPLYMVAFMAVAGLSASAIVASLSYRFRGGARTGLEQGHLGALLLAAMLFKAYFGYSQYMITAYAGIPGELFFYASRLAGEWGLLGILCCCCGVLLPCVLLLLPMVRRNRRVLLGLSIWVILFSALEACWMIVPAMGIGLFDGMFLTASCCSLFIVFVLIAMSLVSAMSHERCFAVDHGNNSDHC